MALQPERMQSLSSIEHFQKGIIQGLPIFLGYVPAAVAFGVLGVTTGLSTCETMAMSAWVFAGASQFMALNLIQNGVNIYEIILATFVLNLRHLLMSTVLSRRIKGSRTAKSFLAFGITDETFVLSTCGAGEGGGEDDQAKGMAAARFAGVALTAYSGWIGGTVLGALFANVLPQVLMKGIGISLYAMFIALLVPSIKCSGRLALVAVLSAFLNWIFSVKMNISAGWSVLTATMLAAAAGAFIYREGPR